jgi:hypothetical protein
MINTNTLSDKAQSMSAKEFYGYIQENFELDGTSSRLVRNILNFVNDPMVFTTDDVYHHLHMLLDGAFGLSDEEIRMFQIKERN